MREPAVASLMTREVITAEVEVQNRLRPEWDDTRNPRQTEIFG